MKDKLTEILNRESAQKELKDEVRGACCTVTKTKSKCSCVSNVRESDCKSTKYSDKYFTRYKQCNPGESTYINCKNKCKDNDGLEDNER